MESQVSAMSSESTDREGSMKKALSDIRMEKDRLVKEKEEVFIAALKTGIFILI